MIALDVTFLKSESEYIWMWSNIILWNGWVHCTFVQSRSVSWNVSLGMSGDPGFSGKWALLCGDEYLTAARNMNVATLNGRLKAGRLNRPKMDPKPEARYTLQDTMCVFAVERKTYTGYWVIEGLTFVSCGVIDRTTAMKLQSIVPEYVLYQWWISVCCKLKMAINRNNRHEM